MLCKNVAVNEWDQDVYRVIECLAFEHDLRLVLLAALVCVGGSILSSQLLSRTFSAKSHQKVIKLLLSAMIGGATIWSTHFVAMLAYDPVFDNGYESVTTLLSLLVGHARSRE